MFLEVRRGRSGQFTLHRSYLSLLRTAFSRRVTFFVVNPSRDGGVELSAHLIGVRAAFRMVTHPRLTE